MRVRRVDVVETAEAENRCGCHEEAHHCAAVEGGQQCVGHAAFARCLTRSHVGEGRSLHPDEAGEEREEGAKKEAEPSQETGSLPLEGEVEEHKDGGRVDREHLVFTNEEGHRALSDVPGNHVHRVSAFGKALNTEVEEHGHYQAEHAGSKGDLR